MNLRKKLQIFYRKFISLEGEPSRIAVGFAIGVFVGTTPTIPFHTAIIVLFGLLFKQNITAGYLGSWIISNPLTIPFLYVSQYEIGRLMLGMKHCRFELADYSFGAIAALGWEILIPLLAGGIIMAPFFAIPAYWITERLIKDIRKREKN